MYWDSLHFEPFIQDKRRRFESEAQYYRIMTALARSVDYQPVTVRQRIGLQLIRIGERVAGECLSRRALRSGQVRSV